MVEVTIPNCYKQAIRSRDASKWHDAMDKEINVMKVIHRGRPLLQDDAATMKKRLIPVAVNSKQNNSYVLTPHMDITYRQTSGLGMASQDIGDIFVAECRADPRVSAALVQTPNVPPRELFIF
ncbi:hypothetical protein TNCV_3559361 [Trichonephila clavipes]|uniref:Uncharacterized protein n=1 Tax=Trichonephila clavipes TaxID=2585209 RepID=A0A8X6WCL3_TRICX|nr:hypothetical protein TNCV_3559361 [Trichonephila clavipes]